MLLLGNIHDISSRIVLYNEFSILMLFYFVFAVEDNGNDKTCSSDVAVEERQ